MPTARRAKAAPKEVVLDESDIAGEEGGEETPPFDTSKKGHLVQMEYTTNRNRGYMEHDKITLSYKMVEGEDIDDVFTYLRDSAAYLLGDE